MQPAWGSGGQLAVQPRAASPCQMPALVHAGGSTLQTLHCEVPTTARRENTSQECGSWGLAHAHLPPRCPPQGRNRWSRRTAQGAGTSAQTPAPGVMGQGGRRARQEPEACWLCAACTECNLTHALLLRAAPLKLQLAPGWCTAGRGCQTCGPDQNRPAGGWRTNGGTCQTQVACNACADCTHPASYVKCTQPSSASCPSWPQRLHAAAVHHQAWTAHHLQLATGCDQEVVWLDITVHHPAGVAELEGPQDHLQQRM